MSKTINVIYNDREHEIPEMWLIGAQLRGLTLLESVEVWHIQTLLKEKYEEATNQ